MRDFCRYFYTVDSQPYAAGTIIGMNYFFNTQAECDNFIAANPVSPGGGTLSPTAPIWFRFDQDIMRSWIQTASPTNLGIPSSPIFSSGKQMIYFESPRKFGINSVEERRVAVLPGDKGAKKSDFSGAAGLIAFINNLPAYAAALRLEGRTRDAGIVLFAFRQVKDLKWTITEALRYLRDNRL